jgi:hypothetical protein
LFVVLRLIKILKPEPNQIDVGINSITHYQLDNFKILKMNTLQTKSEIINWINQLNDESILNNILALKNNQVSKIEADLQKGISINEARKASKEFIKNLPWKNQKL